MKIELKEKAGLTVDGNEILFGDSLEVAAKVLGEYDLFENSCYFLDGTVLFELDSSGKIKEIEVRNSYEDNIEVMFRSLDIFNVEKDEIIRYMSEANQEALEKEDCTYSANNLGVVFSFGMSEEDVDEMIEEAKNDGVYEDMIEDIEQDIYRSKHVEAFLIK